MSSAVDILLLNMFGFLNKLSLKAWPSPQPLQVYQALPAGTLSRRSFPPLRLDRAEDNDARSEMESDPPPDGVSLSLTAS